MLEKIIDDYYNALYDTDYNRALSIINNTKESGVLPEEIVFEIIIPCMDKMLKSFLLNEEASISQHFLASKISEQVVDEMLPLFKLQPEKNGTIILGTSYGDFHGLGRKIVAGCLKASLYNVIDLGLNVAPEKFVDEAIKNRAQIIGISSMMVHSAMGKNGCIRVKELLIEKKLNDKIKVIVGGAPFRFDKNLYRQINADGFAENAIESIKLVSSIIERLK